jgi:hypothetical protein
MSSRHDDSGGDTRAAKLIRDRQERLEDCLDVFTQRAAEASVSPQMKREIAIHIVNFHRVLSNYEDESVLDDGDIPDIADIRDRLGETVHVTVEAAGIGRGQTRKPVPAVDQLNPWYLEDVASDLEAAAKKLGFWEPAKETTPHDDPSEDDLKALLEARGQDEAVANLPSEREGSE